MLIKAGEPQRNIGGRAFIVLLVALVTLMPTYSALAEIHATPVVEPTASPTEEDGELTQDAEGLFTPNEDESKKQDQEIQAIRPMEVVEAGSEYCTERGETIFPGGSYWLDCEYEFSLSVGLGVVAVMTRPPLPPGFTAEIKLSSNGRSSVLTHSDPDSEVELDLSFLGLIAKYEVNATIEIRASGNVSITSTPVLVGPFNSCRKAISLLGLISTSCQQNSNVSASFPVVELPLTQPSYFDLQCEPSDSSTVALNESETADCTVSGGPSLALGSWHVRLDQILPNVTSADGWDVVVSDTSGQPLSFKQGTHQLTNPLLLAADEQYKFRFKVTAVACVAAEVERDIGVSVGVTPVSGENVIGKPQFSELEKVGVTFDQEVDHYAEIIGGPYEVEVAYSLEDEMRSTELEIRFELSPCHPWYGYLGIDRFTQVVGEGETPVLILIGTTAEQISIEQTPPNTTEISNHTVGKVNIGTTDTLVVSGEPPSDSVSVTQKLELEFTIPANTPVGVYTSTIEVTISDAP